MAKLTASLPPSQRMGPCPGPHGCLSDPRRQQEAPEQWVKLEEKNPKRVEINITKA